MVGEALYLGHNLLSRCEITEFHYFFFVFASRRETDLAPVSDRFRIQDAEVKSWSTKRNSDDHKRNCEP